MLAAALFLVLLIPGRIQGILYRDLYRGRRALDQENPAEALLYLERFRGTLRAQPWRKAALWLGWSVYTPSVEAMVFNDIGSSHLALEVPDHAVSAWRTSLELDPLYPIPHANLALVAAAGGERAVAESLLDIAKSIGYSSDALDQTLQKMQRVLARLESRGLSV